MELISGRNRKVVQSLSDRNRELKSGCKGNSGLNDRDLKLKSILKSNTGFNDNLGFRQIGIWIGVEIQKLVIQVLSDRDLE